MTVSEFLSAANNYFPGCTVEPYGACGIEVHSKIGSLQEGTARQLAIETNMNYAEFDYSHRKGSVYVYRFLPKR